MTQQYRNATALQGIKNGRRTESLGTTNWTLPILLSTCVAAVTIALLTSITQWIVVDPAPVIATSQPLPSAQQGTDRLLTKEIVLADAAAVRTVGGGIVVNRVPATLQGQSVWNITVNQAGQLHNVWVSKATGLVIAQTR